MDKLEPLFGYILNHPAAAIGALIGLIALGYLLNRKPKLQREADERLKILRRETERKYDEVRPLR